MKIGIIGATGWLGSALGAGLLSRGIVAAADLVVLNRGEPQPDYQGHADVTWAMDAADLTARCDVVVVSVRPADWRDLALQAEGRLVVSLMAGIRASDLASCGGRIVRAMPNAAAAIGASYSPFWPAADVTDLDCETVAQLLSAIGTTDRLENEAAIDLMTALPGSGSAYPALMAVAMADFMRRKGLPQDIAWRAAEAAVIGGARLLEGRIVEAPAQLATYRDYAGTTAAGLQAAEEAGFSRAVHAALTAAADAARRLG